VTLPEAAFAVAPGPSEVIWQVQEPP